MERSFGIIPLRLVENKWETLLVKHQKGHWAFPKGHPEPNESPQDTASRELKEETGLQVTQFFPLDSLKEFYIFKREGTLVEKHVTYFLAEVEGEVTLQIEELEDFRWISLQEAAKLATFPETKNLPQKVLSILLRHSSE